MVKNNIDEDFPKILDPNTNLNVAKMSYRILEVRDACEDFFNRLNSFKLSFDKNDLREDVNVIFELCTQLFI